MKNKKIIALLIFCVLTAGIFSSCAIDKKCPAYTQVSALASDKLA